MDHNDDGGVKQQETELDRQSFTSEQASRADSVRLRPSSSSHRFVRRRREKSTIILVSIVVIFLVCHTYRLSLRLYEVAHPQNNTLEHFRRCRTLGRYHIPVAFYVLVNFHHLFLVLNSSVNFIIYCAVGKEFRDKMFQLFKCRREVVN